MSKETTQESTNSKSDVSPEIDPERYNQGLISAYEVLDISEEFPSLSDPIRIYMNTSNREGENLSYDRFFVASYNSYEQGIIKNEKEAKNEEKIKKALSIGAVATGVFTAVEYKNIFDGNNSSSNSRDQVLPGVAGAISTFVLIAGAWLAKDARTRARNRKAALEGASKSGEHRFISRFDTKL